MHAHWIIVGARVLREDDALDFRFLVMPPEDVTIDDTWYVDGMQGTGSNDIVIKDLFVPETHSTSMMDMLSGKGHGAKLYSGPLYSTPMIPILALAASMPAVGQARAAVKRVDRQLHFASVVERLVAVGEPVEALDEFATALAAGPDRVAELARIVARSAM
jgi:alkylation response protein AidB-like acyl-CoA dehydrogenase